MSGVITQAVYMGVGAAGAMTDVSSYVDLEAGVDYSYGRDSEFDDVGPGTFSFTVDNPDGRFTPENTSSPYATTVTEGMQVCWQAGARLVTGSVIGIEPAFPGDDAAWAKVVITCDDMLGTAARVSIEGSLTETVATASAYYWFPLDDPVGTVQGAAYRLSGGSSTPLGTYDWWVDGIGVITTYGVEGEPGLFDSQVDLAVPAAGVGYYGASSTITPSVTSGGPTDTLLVLTASEDYVTGMWVTPMNLTSYAEFHPAVGTNTSAWGIRNDKFVFYSGVSATWTDVQALNPEQTYYVEIGVVQSTKVFTLYIDGVQVATSTDTGATIFERMRFVLGNAAYGDTQIRVAQIVVAPTTLAMRSALETTAALRLDLIDDASTSITFDTLPTDLSTATLETSTSGSSCLDLINEVIRAEQGHVYTATTGTVSNPTQKIVVRERDRPVAVTESFDAEDEASGAPSIIREVTNLVAAVTVTNATTSLRVSDAELLPRTTATTSEATILNNTIDMKGWGEDRLIRGANTRLRVETVTIDAFTTPTDRSTDLLALVPGDRIQITDLPEQVLGFDTWDGWLLGAEEHHGLGAHEFTLKLQPVLDDPALYDTDRYMSDEAVTLNANINSAVTSVVYATTGPEMAGAGSVPYNIIVGSEEMTVTAVNAGTNTLTVTRGANGTTAAAHTASDPIELVSNTVYVF